MSELISDKGVCRTALAIKNCASWVELDKTR